VPTSTSSELVHEGPGEDLGAAPQGGGNDVENSGSWVCRRAGEGIRLWPHGEGILLGSGAE
jgi:hypothetical protein